MISFVSMEFLAFVGVTLLLYFWVPARYRWLVLLGSSIYFYFCSGAVQLLVVLGSTGIAYGTALRVEKIHNSDNPDRKEARKHLTSGILLLLFILAYAKVGRRAVEAAGALLGLERIDFEVLVPLGISYYSFSLIGYMADVYWKKDKAEHSYLKLLLYMIYFPHILQGPIPRHRRLAPWLIEGHPFDYRGLCHGLQRMMWGYFKKMVIADRLALLVGTVFDNPAAYGGPVFVPYAPPCSCTATSRDAWILLWGFRRPCLYGWTKISRDPFSQEARPSSGADGTSLWERGLRIMSICLWRSAPGS